MQQKLNNTAVYSGPKELQAEKGKQKGFIRGIERYRIMKLVLKGDVPEGKCVSVPRDLLANQKYWKKESKLSSDKILSAEYEVALEVTTCTTREVVTQCQKCAKESENHAFVLVCAEGVCTTEGSVCLPVICPCLPTHQNRQSTFDLNVSFINKSTRRVEFYSTLPISFRTGRKRGEDDPPSPTVNTNARLNAKFNGLQRVQSPPKKKQRTSPPPSNKSRKTHAPEFSSDDGDGGDCYNPINYSPFVPNTSCEYPTIATDSTSHHHQQQQQQQHQHNIQLQIQHYQYPQQSPVINRAGGFSTWSNGYPVMPHFPMMYDMPFPQFPKGIDNFDTEFAIVHENKNMDEWVLSA